MSEEDGIKGNTGDFGFPPNNKSRRKRPSNNSSAARSSAATVDRGGKIIVALLAGAGAAFLLALILLMSRLESEELNNGLLNSNVGGSRGVDDQIYLEEVAQGHASLGIMPKNSNNKDRINKRQAKLVSKVQTMKKFYDKRLEKITRLVGLPPGNPLEKIVHRGEAELEGMTNAMMGKGAMPKHIDLQKEFMEAIEKDNAKLKERNEHSNN